MIRTNEQAPALSLPILKSDQDDKFDTTNLDKNSVMTIVVFYRGKHCPICIDYLSEIERQYDDIVKANLRIVAVSMDDADRTADSAKAVAEKLGKDVDDLRLPLTYGLSAKQAREWGLYLSSKRAESNEPSVFSEPGLFVLDSKNSNVFMASVQSAPFTRPDIAQLVGGLQFAIGHNYPARGTYTRDDEA